MRVGEIIEALRVEVLKMIRDARGISREELIQKTGAEAARVDYVLKLMRKSKTIVSLRKGQTSVWVDVERATAVYSEMSWESVMARRRYQAAYDAAQHVAAPDPIHQCPSVWHYASRLAA